MLRIMHLLFVVVVCLLNDSNDISVFSVTLGSDVTSASALVVNNVFISYRRWRSGLFETFKSFLIKVRRLRFKPGRTEFLANFLSEIVSEASS